jgi:hypothetical protein
MINNSNDINQNNKYDEDIIDDSEEPYNLEEVLERARIEGLRIDQEEKERKKKKEEQEKMIQSLFPIIIRNSSDEKKKKEKKKHQNNRKKGIEMDGLFEKSKKIRKHQSILEVNAPKGFEGLSDAGIKKHF